ncbi:amidophosphoribosyltransferase [Haloimpatiens sp. FM7330]|uniref:amidophosphoribosyltransferase n=1 Tax=Haloimpatiens sp. FM7330 TaxID=3298610 RepID=UPI0036290D89
MKNRCKIECNSKIVDDKLKEECGVFGIFSREELDVSTITYYGLYALQHRGQESAGISYTDGEKVYCHKSMGLVSEIFNEDNLSNMKGKIAIGHVRYSTTGESNILNAQPLTGHFKLGYLALAHNGNIINSYNLQKNLKKDGYIFQSNTDSEVILNLVGKYKDESIENSIIKASKLLKGSYCIVFLTKDKLIGVRDSFGIRPLCIGKIRNNYIICSESCALDAVGAKFIRDIKPGEIVSIDKKGIKSNYINKNCSCCICSFEYVYFAREDSIIDDIEVYSSRIEMGKQLYKQNPIDADIVVGVPDSAIPAALGYSRASKIPFERAFVKNKYIGRTFIKCSQKMREKSVHIKLNVIKSKIKNKRVVIVDDSIVRGTTSKQLVQILRSAGAKEIHFRVASPIIKHCCYYGIDTKRKEELLGSYMEKEDIRKYIGADSLEYLSVEGLKKVLCKNKGICVGCFNGRYPEYIR